jgi:hypothetical protein
VRNSRLTPEDQRRWQQHLLSAIRSGLTDSVAIADRVLEEIIRPFGLMVYPEQRILAHGFHQYVVHEAARKLRAIHVPVETSVGAVRVPMMLSVKAAGVRQHEVWWKLPLSSLETVFASREAQWRADGHLRAALLEVLAVYRRHPEAESPQQAFELDEKPFPVRIAEAG